MAKDKKQGQKPQRPRPAINPNDKALSKLYGVEGFEGGAALINKFLPQGSLGRVDTNLPGSEQNLERFDDLYAKYSVRDPAQAKVLAAMEAGLGGYTSPEYQAQREQMMRGQQSNIATGMSQLAKAQSRGKVFGAAAAAQQSNLLRSAQQGKDQLEQDLYIKNIDEMRDRNREFGEYGRQLTDEEYGRTADTVKGRADETRKLRDEELERQKVNLGQSNAELAAQIGAFTGAAGTALQQKNIRESQRIQKKALRSLNR